MFDGHTFKDLIAVSFKVSSILTSFIITSYIDLSISLFIPSPLVAFPCGSASINNTFFPFFASIVLKFIDVVVFPYSPFLVCY